MGQIHVGLDFEYHAGKLLFIWQHLALNGIARLRRWGQIDQGIENFPDAEVIDGGAEENRRLLTGKKGLVIELR